MKTYVEYTGKKSFKVKIREHDLVVDLPTEKGGDDAAPTPPEYLIASLGSCVGYFALGYLKAAGFDPEGLTINLDWEFDERGTRIENIDITLNAPNADLGDRKRGLIASVNKCIIHNTLHQCPKMEVTIA